MMTQKGQKYDREFKRKAVELSYARGNSKEIAEELDIGGRNGSIDHLAPVRLNLTYIV